VKESVEESNFMRHYKAQQATVGWVACSRGEASESAILASESAGYVCAALVCYVMARRDRRSGSDEAPVPYLLRYDASCYVGYPGSQQY